MHFKRALTVLIFLIFLVGLTGQTHAGNVQFNGIVVPDKGAERIVIEQFGTLVSFSDRVALTVPESFVTGGSIQISTAAGDAVSGYEMLSIDASNGTKTSIAVVNLQEDTRQSFLVCSDRRCIRYNVIKY